MLTEMRRQITEMLQRSHPVGGLPGDSGFGVSTKIGDDDVPKNKSTSTTKVKLHRDSFWLSHLRDSVGFCYD